MGTELSTLRRAALKWGLDRKLYKFASSPDTSSPPCVSTKHPSAGRMRRSTIAVGHAGEVR